MKWIINKGRPPPRTMGPLEPRDTCPNLANHLYGPESYCGWHDWAEAMAKRGYEQSQCPDCGFWMIWRKVKAAA